MFGPPIAFWKSVSSGPPEGNLQQWWSADTGVTKDGSNLVSQWADRSGNGRHWTQSVDSAKPTWVDNQINGYPVLRVTSTASIRQMLSPNYLTGANTTAEGFFVLKSGQGVGTANYCHARFGGSGDSPHYRFSDGNIYETFGRAARLGFAANEAVVRAYNIYHVIVDSVTPLYQVTLAGTSLYSSGAAFTLGWNAEANGVRIFSFEGSFGWLGDHVEGLIYSPRLSAPNSAAARSYLANKYALT